MANKIGSPDDVTTATDALMKSLLKYAAKSEDIDMKLAVVQASTRWVATKNKLSVPEEGNAFDGFRAAIGAAAPAAAADTTAAPRDKRARPPRTAFATQGHGAKPPRRRTSTAATAR